MLCKLSIRNIRKSVSDYSIYFFTLLLGVCIFYVFNAIQDQTAMMELSRMKSNMIQVMNQGLSAMSVLVSCILGFLIVYASRFLIRKRTREFGIYLTLGMRKSSIAAMLLLETFVIGLVSLTVGLVAGVVLSQFMSLLVSGIFAADMDHFVFVVSAAAIRKTILYYVLIYVVVAIANTISVVRSSLIDLLLANRKKEQVHLTSSLACVVVFLVACVLLGVAYRNVTGQAAKALKTEFDVLRMMAYGALGTVLVFWSVSGFVLRFSKKLTGLYFRGTNSFVINETGNRIHSFVLVGSIICLLLFVTICVMSGAFSLKRYKDDLLEKRVPASVSMTAQTQEDRRISDLLRERGFDESALTNVTEFSTFWCDQVTHMAVLGEAGERIVEQEPFWEDFLAEELEMIHQSDYNAAAKRYGYERVSLGENEYQLCMENEKSAFAEFVQQAGTLSSLTVGGQTLHSVRGKNPAGFLMMSDDVNYHDYVIVPDSVVPEQGSILGHTAYLIADYKKEYETKGFYHYMDDGGFDEQVNPDGLTSDAIFVATKTALTDGSVGTSGIMIFLALYLGVAFMLCSAALLALKSMSDAMEGREKYQVLRQLGANDREVNRALGLQMGIFFGFPLALAAVHSIFGIQVVNEMLSIYQSDALLPALLLAAAMIVLIYGGYFLVSYLLCRKVIAADQ